MGCSLAAVLVVVLDVESRAGLMFCRPVAGCRQHQPATARGAGKIAAPVPV